MKVSIITEAYNITEGQSTEALVRTIQFIDAYLAMHSDAEALLMDSSGGELASRLLEGMSKNWRCVSRQGASYDDLKDIGAEEARGQYVCYLDGDCIPHSKDWVDLILAPIITGSTPVVGGLTIYENDSALAHACSILDFGFLFHEAGSSIGCYASNNIAFEREFRVASKVPKTGLRCACYAHAMQMMRNGTPVILEPNARVYHELPSLRKERYRRGYDHVAACWADPLLPATKMLDGSEQEAWQRIREEQLNHARQRHLAYQRLVDLDESTRSEIEKLFPRLVDLERFGVRRAFREGEATGKNAKTLETHRKQLYARPKPAKPRKMRHMIRDLLRGR